MAKVLLERETGEGEACEALLDNKWDEYLAREDDIIAAKDYGRWGVEIDGRTTVPVCFLADNHTTGGNSGSPVLNGRGELIGVNFDRTWLSTMSDIAFDPAFCRNIALDIRYVLFVIDRIGDASYLFEEMDFAE